MIRFPAILLTLALASYFVGKKWGSGGNSDWLGKGIPAGPHGALSWNRTVPAAADIAGLLALASPGQPEQAAKRIWSAILPLNKDGVSQAWAEMPNQKARGEAWVQVYSALLERLKEFDPAAAALRPGSEGTVEEALAVAAGMSSSDAREFLLKMPELPNRSRAIGQYARGLAEKDPGEACAFFEGLGPGQCRESAGISIGSVWLGKDPEAALAWVQTLEPVGFRKGMLQKALGEAAIAAPEAVARILPQVHDPDSRLTLVRLNSFFLGQSPESAAAWIQSLPPGSLREEALEMMIYSIPLKDSGKAMELISAMPVGKKRRDLLDNMAGKFGAADPARGREWLATLSDSDQVSALAKMCQAIANSKPMSEIEAFVATLPENLAEPAAEGITRGLKFSDAVGWVERVYTDPEARAAAQLSLIEDGEGFSAAIGNYALGLPPSPERDEKINRLMFQSMAGTAAGEVLKWIDTVPADQQKRLLPTIISTQNTWGGSAEALKSVEKFRQLPGVSGEEVAGVLYQTMSNWLKADPEKALEWAATGPPGQLAETMKLTAHLYSEKNAVAAAKWALEQENPDIIKAAAQGFVASDSREIKAMVAQLSAKLPPDEEAMQLLESSLPALYASDPEAAGKVLENKAFSAGQVERLRKLIPLPQPAAKN